MWGATDAGRSADGVLEHFYPRAPCGARPSHFVGHLPQRLDFYPRAPCGARRRCEKGSGQRIYISIHAPRVGRDRGCGAVGKGGKRIFLSTRPVWGATLLRDQRLVERPAFLSTRPVWGATPHPVRGRGLHRNFYPRAPCGARPRRDRQPLLRLNFYPRAPCGARQPKQGGKRHRAKISIHAPRVGRDHRATPLSSSATHFYPRAPWGARQIAARIQWWTIQFLSTRPVGGATRSVGITTTCIAHFYPRAPWGARRLIFPFYTHSIKISIHAPRGGRDLVDLLSQ